MTQPVVEIANHPSGIEIAAVLVQAVAALVLVAVTSWYAWATHKLVAATRNMVQASEAAVAEMQAQRLAQAESLRREKSDGAAQATLAHIAEADDEVFRTGASWLDPGRCRALRAAIRRSEWGISDDVVRERLDLCRTALWTVAAEWTLLGQERRQGLAQLRLRIVVEHARWTLEAYISRRPLPHWPVDVPADDLVRWLTSG